MLRPPLLLAALALAGLYGLSGCEKRLPQAFPLCTDAPPSGDAGSGAPPTYYGSIRPILDARCNTCHTAGGLAPFALDAPDAAVRHAGEIAAAVTSREMPPWLPDRCCAEFHSDPSLTGDQIAAINAWVDAGSPLGDPAQPGPALPSLPGMSRVDLTLRMPAPYTPRKIDEQRCFVLDWPDGPTRYVTGLNLQTGNRSVVHHVIVYLADRGSADDLHKEEGKDGQPGFDCTGGLLGAKITGAIGGWQPGSAGIDFPDGLGTKVEPHSAIILNIHYSLAHGGSGSDLTSLQFKLDDQARPMKGIAVGDALWMIDDGMRIPAGAKGYVYNTELEPSALYNGGKPLLLYNVMLHMHQFATRGLLMVRHPDGVRECLLQISRWDMGWTGTFWFTQPRRINPGDQIYLECDYDNPTDHDLVWANSGEMCAGFGSYVDVP